jgi:hypothetical protein
MGNGGVALSFLTSALDGDESIILGKFKLYDVSETISVFGLTPLDSP